MEPLIYRAPGPFALELGGRLDELRIAYKSEAKRS